MRSDIKAIKAWNHLKSSTAGGEEIDWDCEYVEYSTVPDQTGGPFWSILNRIFIRMSPLSLTCGEADDSIRVPAPYFVRDWIPKAIIRGVLTDPWPCTWSRLLRCLSSSVSISCSCRVRARRVES